MNKIEPQVIFLKPSPEVISVDFFTERVLSGDDYALLQEYFDNKMYDEIPVLLELICYKSGELKLVVGCVRYGLDLQVISVTITKDFRLDVSYYSPQEIMEEYLPIIPDNPGQIVEYIDSFIFATNKISQQS